MKKKERKAQLLEERTRRADHGLAHATIRKLLYLNLWTAKNKLQWKFMGQLPPDYGMRRNLVRRKPYRHVEGFLRTCFERCLRDMERGGDVELRVIDKPPKDESCSSPCWQARLTKKGMQRKLTESGLQPAVPASLSENTSLQVDTVLKMLLASHNTITGLRSSLKDVRLKTDAALAKYGSGETDIYEFDQMESCLDHIEASVLTLVDSFTFRVGGALTEGRDCLSRPVVRFVSSKHPSGLKNVLRHNNPW